MHLGRGGGKCEIVNMDNYRNTVTENSGWTTGIYGYRYKLRLASKFISFLL